MPLTRRGFVEAAGTLVLAAALPGFRPTNGASQMYGLIGKFKAVPGQRDALIAILLEGIADMPGCLSYVVAQDPGDPDAVWITEAWDGKASHAASLQLPSVQAAIGRARPIIASFGEHFETVPVGGHGLARAG
ncbi:MAG TPA: putative quinol monooxygenase [Longimicrobiaceae bacterium]|nr:putative quinol monooxygenase [Longimicrobiaceae bacterium]